MIVWIVEHVCESGFHNVEKVFAKKADGQKYIDESRYMNYRWRLTKWKVTP